MISHSAKQHVSISEVWILHPLKPRTEVAGSNPNAPPPPPISPGNQNGNLPCQGAKTKLCKCSTKISGGQGVNKIGFGKLIFDPPRLNGGLAPDANVSAHSPQFFSSPGFQGEGRGSS